MSEDKYIFNIVVYYDKIIKAESYDQAKTKLLDEILNNDFIEILDNMMIYHAGCSEGSLRDLEREME